MGLEIVGVEVAFAEIFWRSEEILVVAADPWDAEEYRVIGEFVFKSSIEDERVSSRRADFFFGQGGKRWRCLRLLSRMRGNYLSCER